MEPSTILNQAIRASAYQNQILIDYNVPSGNVLKVTNIVIETQPGEGQTTAYFGAYVLYEGGVPCPYLDYKNNPPIEVGRASKFLWQGEAFVYPGGRVRTTSVFSGATASNRALLYIHGLLYPVGSIGVVTPSFIDT